MLNKKFSIFILLSLSLILMVRIPSAYALDAIYIKPDGTVDPTDAPIQKNGNVYTFTDNIIAALIVQKSDLTINGDNFSLKGDADNYGIFLNNVNNITIEDLVIENCNVGIYFSSSDNNTVTGTTITENLDHGILLYYANNNKITESMLVYNYGIAIEIDHSTNNIITQNSMINNDGNALVLYNSSENTGSANEINDNGANGIYLYSSSNNQLIANNISLNVDSGIYLYSDSDNNNIYHNNLFDNNEQVTISSSGANIWDNGIPSGGNYWSDYNGQDNTGDGIGDTPYIINQNNQDNYPLSETFIIPEFPSGVFFALTIIIMLSMFFIVKLQKKNKDHFWAHVFCCKWKYMH